MRSYSLLTRPLIILFLMGHGLFASEIKTGDLNLEIANNLNVKKELATLDTSWEKVSDEDGIAIHRREIQGSLLVEFRGETVMEANIPRIVQVLGDTFRKHEWIDRLHTARDLEVISSLERYEYNRTRAPWPVKDRDFVFHSKGTLDRESKTLSVELKSVEKPGMPEQSCCVRGKLLSSCYILQELDSNRTRVIVRIHADPGGSVPLWIVNLIQKSWPRKTLRGIMAQLKKPDVLENEEVKKLLSFSP